METTTSLVTHALRGADDFMDHRMIMAATGRTTNQVSAALHSLRKYRVVDVVIEKDGHGWWFLLPPESDQRTSTREEQTPESKPRKPRKRKPKGLAGTEGK